MKKSIVTNVKRLLYYLPVLYVCTMSGVFFACLLKDGPIMELIETVALYPIIVLGLWIPYNALILIVMGVMYYFNEIKKKKTLYSACISILMGLIFLIAFGIWDSNTRKFGGEYVSFWDSVGFSGGYTGQVFLLGFTAALLTFIPLHDRFRKKYRFLEEARE